MQLGEALAQLDKAADAAAARGSLLFHLDLAAEVARAAFASQAIDRALSFTLVDGDGYRVLAFDDAPLRRVVAQATFDTLGDVIITRDAIAVAPRASILADAYVAATATSFSDAIERAFIVVPTHDPALPLEVYALATSDDPDEVRLAGHRLLTLDRNGQRVRSQRELIVASAPARCSVRTLRDLVLTISDAVPSEVHTYLSLKHGLPLIVASEQSGLRWRVDAERTQRL